MSVSSSSSSSQSMTNYARIGHAAQQLLPELLQDLIALKEPQHLLHRDVCNNNNLHRRLRSNEMILIQNATTKGYANFDIPLIYSLLRNLNLVPPPSQGWDCQIAPTPSETTPGDDIERLRRARNAIVHRGNASVTDTETSDFFSMFKDVAGRLELYLGKQKGDYVTKFQQLETCCIDETIKKMYLQSLSELSQRESDLEMKVDNVINKVKKIKDRQRKVKTNVYSEYLAKDLKDTEIVEGCDARFELWTRESSVTVEWFKGDNRIEVCDKYNVETSCQIHTLVVNNSDWSDRGIYTAKLPGLERCATLTVIEFFKKNMKKIYKCNEGDNVDLSCAVIEDKVTAHWEKDDVSVQHCDRYKIIAEGKNHKLSIIHLNPHDAGDYSVRISDRKRSTSLQVKEYFTKPLATMTCVEGENIQFECEVLQNNRTSMWFKDGSEIITSDKYKVERHGKLHRLLVNNTNLDDQGEYSVKINNCVRQSELTVQEYFTKPLSDMTCIKGESIQIECEVLEDNQTAIWFKDGTEVSISDKFKVGRHGKFHRLVVNNAQLHDQGLYSVKINNCVRRSKLTVQEIPAAFGQLTEEDRGLYLELIKSATETRYYIRILIIGENGVGKTCLLRRLLGEPIEDVTSTDGIDVVHRCKIRRSDGQWIIDKDTNKRKEMIVRIKRAVTAKTYDDVNMEHKQYSQSGIAELLEDQLSQPGTSTDNGQTLVKRKFTEDNMEVSEPSTSNTDDKRQGSSDVFSLPEDELMISISETNKLQMALENIEPRLEKVLTETILNDFSQFINDIEKYDIPEEVMVDCGIWDFAGQRQYYPTHPIFLNPNAVHLLVADITKDIKQIHTEGGYDKIGEYLDFWFDSIHSCGAVEARKDSTGEYLNPPVILVCTGIDKCKDKLDERKNEFRRQLMSMMHNEDKKKHLRRICYISNTQPLSEDFDYLRQSIFEFGQNIETFGEKLPLKWIRLEQLLDIVREANVNILSWSDMADLASRCAVNDEKEINLFLKYHHKVGTIIYFESLKENIILNQQWLADAFRCFVSDKYDDDLKLTNEWKTLEDTGELKPSLIDKLFQKERERVFYKHKDHLLKLMEMFGIIVKLTNLTDNGKNQSLPAYYMPCMISDETSISQIYDMFGVKKETCTPTPWLCIQFEFMPFDFFNHIFYHYVTHYTVCTEALSGRMALYHGMGVFFLDKTKARKFILCFSKNTVAMQIWEWRKLEQGKCKSMLDELSSVIHTVKDKYELRSVSFSVKAKCAYGNIHFHAGRYTHQEFVNEEYFCEEHNEMHDTRHFFQTWFEDYSEDEHYEPPMKMLKG